MHRTRFLLVNGLGEAATGLVLLAWPDGVVDLLLGVTPDAGGRAVGRILGAALVALGLACWPARRDPGGPALVGLLAGMVAYDVAAATVLAAAGLVGNMTGLALWPAVAAHVVLAAWGIACLCRPGVQSG